MTCNKCGAIHHLLLDAVKVHGVVYCFNCKPESSKGDKVVMVKESSK